MKNKLKLMFIRILLYSFILSFLFSNLTVLADDLSFENEIETSSFYTESSSTKENLKLNSRSCIVLDRTSKKILYGKNEFNKVKMASTTKIMTAIVVIENNDLNKTIEVSKKAANTGGSRLGLKTGDKITIHDLLYGLMLCSGNDAAVALAECTAGSVPEFSNLMNNKATELGLLNSHFESPHGLDSDNHYTTAYELAKLSDYALKNEKFSQVVGTKSYTVTINGNPKNLSNTNELLGNLNGVYGIKTGFTNGANRCLVTACKRGDMDIISVVLGADTKNFRTQDSIKLIEYAFSNFKYVNIREIVDSKFKEWKLQNINTFSIDKKSFDSNLDINFSELNNSTFPIRNDEKDNIQFAINVNKNFMAPVAQGTVIGNIDIYTDSTDLASVPIFITDNIYKNTVLDYFGYFLKNFNTLYSFI